MSQSGLGRETSRLGGEEGRVTLWGEKNTYTQECCESSGRDRSVLVWTTELPPQVCRVYCGSVNETDCTSPRVSGYRHRGGPQQLLRGR